MRFPVKRPHVPNFDAVVREFSRVALETGKVAVRLFAEQETRRFKERIKTQRFTSFVDVPLSPSYLQHKINAGLDPRTMISTGHYVRSIRVFQRNEPAYLKLRIGFHPRAQARTEDGKVAPIKLNLLAKVHEFGAETRNIPARPHWRPHLAEMRRRATAMRQTIKTEILRRLARVIPGVHR